MHLPLFDLCPQLAERVEPLPLCTLPTPLQRLSLPGGLAITVKRDDCTADRYGGNKVRKLEFLLADARAQGSNTVLTFGFAGSNFAAATAWYARQQGMDSLSLLLPQQAESYVRDNLLLQQVAGAELFQRPGVPMLGATALWQMLRKRLATGKWPYWIPAGGSSPIGVLGFVNAALELRNQLDAEMLESPTHIYVAMGSMGSVAGLAIGSILAGLDLRVVAVRVVEQRFANDGALRKLIKQVCALLTKHGLRSPGADEVMQRIDLRPEFFGAGYGVAGEADHAAMRAMQEAGLGSDPAYTAKAMACLLADHRADRLLGQRPCFWLTCNNHSLKPLTEGADWRALPSDFHGYFAND